MSEYVLNDKFSWGKPFDKQVELEQGTFVRPIYEGYLPAHFKGLTKNDLWDRYSISEKVEFEWCYTHYGILPIPVGLIRKVK